MLIMYLDVENVLTTREILRMLIMLSPGEVWEVSSPYLVEEPP